MLKYINKLPEILALIVSLIIVVLSIVNGVNINTISYRILICAPICYVLGLILKYYIRFTFEHNQEIDRDITDKSDDHHEDYDEFDAGSIDEVNEGGQEHQDESDINSNNQAEFTPFQVGDIEKVEKNK